MDFWRGFFVPTVEYYKQKLRLSMFKPGLMFKMFQNKVQKLRRGCKNEGGGGGLQSELASVSGVFFFFFFLHCGLLKMPNPPPGLRPKFESPPKNGACGITAK